MSDTTTVRTVDKRSAGWFKPGNPGGPGRPKGLATYVREQTNDGREIVDFMLTVFRGNPLKFTIKAKDGAEKQVELPADLEHRLKAAEWLSDRGWGKPLQKIEETSERRAYIIGLLNQGRDPLAELRDEERVLEAKALPEAGT